MKGIYKITNKINNKSYIGYSNNIERRWQEHMARYNCQQEYNKVLYKAIRKYGLSNFSFEVIEETENLHMRVAPEISNRAILILKLYVLLESHGTRKRSFSRFFLHNSFSFHFLSLSPCVRLTSSTLSALNQKSRVTLFYHILQRQKFSKSTINSAQVLFLISSQKF